MLSSLKNIWSIDIELLLDFLAHVCSYSDFGGSAACRKMVQNRRFCVLYAKTPTIGGFAPTAKTPKSEVLRTLRKNSKIGGFALTQKLQNRRFSWRRVVKTSVIIFIASRESEVLRTIRKNSKSGGFAPTAKTPKSEVLRTLRKNSKIGVFCAHLSKHPEIGGSSLVNKNMRRQYLIAPKSGGSAYYTQKLQNRRFCAHRKNSKIGGSA